MKLVICPYCGETQGTGDHCRACGGLFEPLSRQASHNAMGPWFVRDERRPFQPGCSYETLVKLVDRGVVSRVTVIRGPTTKQFWTVARRVPGIAHLLGYCHNCDASVDPGDNGCHACGVAFGAYLDRNYMGLPEIRPLPWEAGSEEESRRTSAAAIDFRRAAEPLGISSFASDREVRHHQMSSTTHATPSIVSQQEVAVHEAPASTTTASEGMSDPRRPDIGSAVSVSEAAVATRSLQRRISHQQRTIRTMIVFVAVMAIATIVALAALFAQMGQSSDTQQLKPAAKDNQSQKSSPIDGRSAVEGRLETLEINVDEDFSGIESPEISEPVLNVTAMYDEAQALLSKARDKTRARIDRLSDYEAVLDLLGKLAAEPKVRHPKDLEKFTSTVESERDGLLMEA